MKTRGKFFAVACLAALAGAAPAQTDVTLDVEANRQRIYFGESFIAQVKISGTDRAVEPDMSGIADADVRQLDSREISNYSIAFINGRMVRDGFIGRVISYEIIPRRPGPFRAGPVTLNLDGRRFTAPGPEIMVTDVTPQDEVQIAVEASRNTVLVDEPFEVRLRLRIRTLTGRFAETDPLFPNNPPLLNAPFLESAPIPGLSGPDMQALLRRYLARRQEQSGVELNSYTLADDPFNFRGFFDGFREPRRARFALPRRTVEVDGQSFIEYHMELNYLPEQEGDYVFGPVTFKGSIPATVDENGYATGRDIFAVGHACTVRVAPPPEAGRPASFTGAIGTNMRVHAALDCLNCNAGDPVRLTLTFTGQVRFDRMLPIKLEAQTNLLENFAVYDQTVETLSDNPGQRRFVYTIRPRRAGMLELPPITAAYYDTATREYVVMHTAPVPLEVRPGVEITADQIIGGTSVINGAKPAVPDAALTPAPVRMPPYDAHSIALEGGLRFWMIIVAGPCVYILLVIAQRWRERRRHGLAVRRRRALMKQTRRRLHRLIAGAGAARDANTASICALIRDFLAARMGRPAPGMTPMDLRRLAGASGLSDEDAARLAGIYQRHFEAGYSRARHADADDGVRRDARELAGMIVKYQKIIMLALLLAAGALHAATSEQDFLRQQAGALAGTAVTPADWRRAALTWQQLVDTGARNGPLFYNLGTAWLNAGEYAPAVAALQRAERHMGDQPDVMHNLKIARARRDGMDNVEWPWYRVVFAWHFKLTMFQRLHIAAWAFLGIWAGLVLLRMGLSRAGKTVLWPLLFIWVVFTSSYIASIHHEHQSDAEVIGRRF